MCHQGWKTHAYWMRKWYTKHMKYLKVELVSEKPESSVSGDEAGSGVQSVFVKQSHVRWFALTAFAMVVLLAAGLYASLYKISRLETEVSLQSAAVLEQQVLSSKTIRGMAAAPNNPPMPEYQDIAIPDGTPMLGSADAKVTIVEFADYQCPFCKRLFDDTLPKIKSKYIDSGQVKFYYLDFAFLGQESVDAAMATYCAQDQGKYWEYHDYLYENQRGENIGVFSRKNLVSFARALKLDSAQFSSCLESEIYAGKVDEQTRSGRQYGVRGTPGTFVNGKFISGAQPFEVFRTAIEAELSK